MTRRLLVEADGGSRGNPGVAGFGALVRDPDSGVVLAERAEPLGRASNNVAEYSGLVAGLVAAAEIAPDADVLVRMDSKLVVEQMSGRWKIKHADMRRLADEAQMLVDAFCRAGGSVRYEWIPRARNKDADALSNDAMDGRSITRRHDDAASADGGDGGRRDATGPAAHVGPPPGWRQGILDADTDADTSETATITDQISRGRAGGGMSPAAPEATGASGAPSPSRGGGEPTRVVLVRHGVTDNTTSGRLDGRGGSDPALSDEGVRQARAAAAGVEAFLGRAEGSSGHVRVVTSTLCRARQTGEVVASRLDVPVTADPAWDEQHVGDFGDRSLAELSERFGDELAAMRVDPDVVPPGGESFTRVRERVVAALTAETERGSTVVVATHRGPIMAVLGHVLGLTHEAAWRLALAPASLTSLRIWPDGGLVVEFVNDTSHLR